MSGLWPLVWRALAARPLRSALTVVAIALGIAVVLAVQVTLDGLDAQAVAAQQASAGQSGLDVRVDAGTGLSTAQVDRLGSLPGVAEAVPLYEKRVIATVRQDVAHGLAVTLVGLQGGEAALRPVDLVAGRLPHPGSTSEIAIDQGLAGALDGLGAGSPLRLGTTIQLVTATGPDDFRVVGLTAGTSAGPAFTHTAVFVDDRAMLGTFRLGLRTPLVALRLDPGRTAAGVAAEVHHALGTQVTTFDPAAAGTAPLGDLRPLLALVILLSVAIGAGVTANSVALAVLERRRDIGLLRAAGASSAQVFRLFGAEAALIAAAAAPLGVAAGVLLAALLEAHFTPAGLAVPPLAVGPGQLGAALAAGLGAALLGGALSALAAGRVSVLGALRLHPEARRDRLQPGLGIASAACLLAAAACFLDGAAAAVAAGSALCLLGVALAMPALAPWLAMIVGRLAAPLAPSAGAAASNLARARTRTALTSAGLSVSIAVAVAMSALTAGALTASDGWVGQLFPGDMVLTSSVTQRDAVATAIADSSDVVAVTKLRTFTAPVAGTVLGLTALDATVYAGRGGLDVVTPDRQAALGRLEQGPSVLVPETLADAAGWQPGQVLPVQTQRGTVGFAIAGVVAHSFPAGDGGETLVVASDVARSYFGATADGFDDLVLSTDGNTQGVADTAATYGLQAVTVNAIQAAARDALQHSIGLLLALAVVSVTIALLAVVTTLVVNVRQGTRDLALLRAVGLGRSHALRIVVAECGLLALAAGILGVATGCVVAVPMLRASSSPAFTPGFTFPLVTAAVLVCVVVLAALLAAAGPARRATASSVMAALRQE